MSDSLVSCKSEKFYFRKKRDASIDKKYRSYFRILTLCPWMEQKLQCNVKHTFSMKWFIVQLMHTNYKNP